MLNRSSSILRNIENRILMSNVEEIKNEDILTGKVGLALSCLHIYRLNKKSEYLDKISVIIDDIFKNITNETSQLLNKISLANGIPGLGLLLHELIKDEILDRSYLEQIEILTETIYTKCISEIYKENFDYFLGSIGLLYYLIEVEKYKKVDHIVNIIYSYANKNNFLFYNNVDDPYTQGINFGFAHGTCAIISVLIRIYTLGIQTEKIKEIILNTTDSLITFSSNNVDYKQVQIMNKGWDYPSFFPYNITTRDKVSLKQPTSKKVFYHFTDRLGWCNSDLSRMYLLYKIGQLFTVQKYITLADLMINKTIKRIDYKDTAISDCYMCHGTSGVAYIYKKLFKITKNKIFKTQYNYWIEQTISYVNKDIEISKSDEDLELLTGLLGPYFVLSEYNNINYTKWDNIFLIN